MTTREGTSAFVSNTKIVALRSTNNNLGYTNWFIIDHNGAHEEILDP